MKSLDPRTLLRIAIGTAVGLCVLGVLRTTIIIDGLDDPHRLVLGVIGVISLLALGLLVTVVVVSLRNALDVQQRELMEILEHVPVGVIVRTADDRPYYANRAARRLVGQPDEHGQYPLFEAGTDQRYPHDRAPITRALAGDEIEVSDMEVRHDGDIVPLHVRGGAVRRPDGAIAYAVAAFQDARELHRHAMRDALTGLANRASVHQTFRRDRMVAERGARALTVALIDLDRFKAINDDHGHAMGDRVLCAVAASIVESLRRSDVVARWGGEELLVILPDTDLDGGRRAVANALQAVRALTFLGADHEPFGVSFSAGVATVRLRENLDSVVARADAVLYKAKRAGRDRVFDETAIARPTGVLAAVELPTEVQVN